MGVVKKNQRGQSQRDCVFQPRVSEPWVTEIPFDFNPVGVAERLFPHAGKRQAGFPPAPPRCRDGVYSSYLPA